MVRPVNSPSELQAFLTFPWSIYRSDPQWVPPLLDEVERRLDPDRNPFFEYAERELFLAWHGQQVIGRIAAIVNHQHNAQLGERTGFFGFFETIDGQAVSDALLGAAGAWLTERGMTVIRGPVNGAPTDEIGVLVSGHHRRPAMWEGHNPPFYRDLLERGGFAKYHDAYAYELDLVGLGPDLRDLPPAVWRVHERAARRGDVRVRALRTDAWDRDIEIAHGLYNTAFRTIPGHTDMSLEKFRQLAGSMRPFIDPELALVVEVGGQPVGFALALPDLNEVLRHLDGRLTAWGRIKLMWHRRRIRTMCAKLMGVLPEQRGRGLETLLGVEMARHALRRGYRRAEISLVSERNTPLNRLAARIGAEVYRTYRIYERPL